MSEYERKVGERGQVTIPKDLRNRAGISPGDELVFIETNDGIIIQPPTDDDRLAEGYRKYADRSRELAAELGDAPSWSE